MTGQEEVRSQLVSKWPKVACGKESLVVKWPKDVRTRLSNVLFEAASMVEM